LLARGRARLRVSCAVTLDDGSAACTLDARFRRHRAALRRDLRQNEAIISRSSTEPGHDALAIADADSRAECRLRRDVHAIGKPLAWKPPLVAYANAVRWGDFEQALAFVDPETLKAHPLSSIDMERYRQVKVCRLHRGSRRCRPAAHAVRQVVQISLVNINTQTERSIVDKQLWRYDEKKANTGI